MIRSLPRLVTTTTNKKKTSILAIFRHHASSSSLTREASKAVASEAEAAAAQAVGKWILVTSATVVGMIQVGAWTRLTKSGLSMTDWTFTGSLPPLNRQEWLEEFARYQTFPEWQQRKSMTLSEFQYIYWWEYSHRMLGRGVGLIFGLPWIYFSVRGKIPAGFQPRMVGLLAMGGTQGLVGWWMVKSGLGEDRRDDRKEIRVTPIRLAAHLTMAIATYSALLWVGMDLLSLQHQTTLAQYAASLSKDALHQASRLRAVGLGLSGLTVLTITSGALVAGNDAGLAFNTYPKMDGEWIPSGILELEPWYRNLVENTATVQWNHRVLGSTTACTALYLAVTGLRQHAACLTPQVQRGLYAVGLAATGQATLGVTTLLLYVPLSLAAAHQFGAVAVVTSSLYLAHSLRFAARPAVLQRSSAALRGAASLGK